MSVGTRSQKAIGVQEAYDLSGHYHGLMVYGAEGPNGESVEKLARLIDEQTRGLACKTAVECKLWVGDSIPCPIEDWQLVNARLIECVPVTSTMYSAHHRFRTFRISGYLVGPKADTTYIVFFRGKFAAAYSHLGKPESEVGYIKTASFD